MVSQARTDWVSNCNTKYQHVDDDLPDWRAQASLTAHEDAA